jgi:hypothetical protein
MLARLVLIGGGFFVFHALASSVLTAEVCRIPAAAGGGGRAETIRELRGSISRVPGLFAAGESSTALAGSAVRDVVTDYFRSPLEVNNLIAAAPLPLQSSESVAVPDDNDGVIARAPGTAPVIGEAADGTAVQSAEVA